MGPRFFSRVEHAFRSVKNKCPFRPRVGLIAGSGLSDLLSRFEGVSIPYSRIKGFPRPGVPGHAGFLKIGRQAVLMGGRFHAYESLHPDDAVLSVFLLQKLGVKTLILTNAAGGIREDLAPGDLVLISDHLNLTGLHPLRGRLPVTGADRFTDMAEAYSARLRDLAKGLFPDLKEGIYAGVLGPSYETPAEARMLEKLGADLVGMSTVLETIAARFLKMEVLGVSLIANRTAQDSLSPLSHEEVLKSAAGSVRKLAALLEAVGRQAEERR